MGQKLRAVAWVTAGTVALASLEAVLRHYEPSIGPINPLREGMADFGEYIARVVNIPLTYFTHGRSNPHIVEYGVLALSAEEALRNFYRMIYPKQRRPVARPTAAAPVVPTAPTPATPAAPAAPTPATPTGAP